MVAARVAFRPPAPVPLPLPLGPISLLKALARNPIECWTLQHFEEPIVLGGFPFARVAVVSAPAAIRQILVEGVFHFPKSALERRVLSADLRDGLVAIDGEQWHSQRRTLAPLFGRKAIAGFVPAMWRAATALLDRWRALPRGSMVEIKTEMSRVAHEGLAGCIFANGLGRDPEATRAAMIRFFANDVRIDPFDILGLPDFVPRFTKGRARRLLRTFEQSFGEAIAERRGSRCPRHACSRDMLDALLEACDPETGQRMSEDEVKANVLAFIFAGQETMSTALTWALYLLSKSPQWTERVTAEAQSALPNCGEPLPDRLVETRAVINEAMRLYPPITAITRSASRPTSLAGRDIARGTTLIISPYVLHRHRRLWDEPDMFDPSRFLDEAARKIEHYAFLPFGVGPRMCIGASFALQEAALVLAAIVKNYALTLLPDQDVWPLQRFTLRPRDPLWMAIAPR